MLEPVTIWRKISTGCPFCNMNETWIERRIFYRDKNWYAILAAPFHTKGHTILAAIPNGSKCPKEPSQEVLCGLSTALANTIEIVKKCYQPKDVLLSSVRGDISHYHFHLIPLYEGQEKKWRKDWEQDEKGHLMQFLGDLEKEANKRDKTERRKEGWSEEEQRKQKIISLGPDIEKLRKYAGYREK